MSLVVLRLSARGQRMSSAVCVPSMLLLCRLSKPERSRRDWFRGNTGGTPVSPPDGGPLVKGSTLRGK